MKFCTMLVTDVSLTSYQLVIFHCHVFRLQNRLVKQRSLKEERRKRTAQGFWFSQALPLVLLIFDREQKMMSLCVVAEYQLWSLLDINDYIWHDCLCVCNCMYGRHVFDYSVDNLGPEWGQEYRLQNEKHCLIDIPRSCNPRASSTRCMLCTLFLNVYMTNTHIPWF